MRTETRTLSRAWVAISTIVHLRQAARISRRVRGRRLICSAVPLHLRNLTMGFCRESLIPGISNAAAAKAGPGRV